MEEEADADEENHTDILMCLVQLHAVEDAASILGGSSAGPKISKPRQRLEGHATLYNDYFSNDPTYTAKKILRRYRMNKKISCCSSLR
jgi:hypothetical protein